MMQVRAQQPLGRIEVAVRSAAQRHHANLLSVMHVGQLVRDQGTKDGRDVIVFTICQPELSAALLAADIRFTAFIPCRITVFDDGGEVVLEALSPSEMCKILERPDLMGPAAALEAELGKILEEAAKPLESHVHAEARSLDIGATEEQVHARGMVPQRIDCRGTKVEELAGTGQHDAAGG